MTSMEGMCRQYDKRITGCAWLLAILIVWCVVAPGIGTTVKYTGNFEPGVVEKVPALMVRAQTRLMHRVVRALQDQCANTKSPFVLAPQISVNQQPFRYNIVHMCNQHEPMLNARVIVQGKNSGTCLDGLETRVTRPFPVTVAYDTLAGKTGSLSLLTLAEVCPVLYAMDLMSDKW